MKLSYLEVARGWFAFSLTILIIATRRIARFIINIYHLVRVGLIFVRVLQGC